MTKKSKWIYIIGSIVIGVVALLTVLGVLIAGGFVNVEKRRIVIESKSQEFTFDGSERAYEEWEIIDGKLKNGHTAVVTITGKQKDVGESENFISAKIVDENNADVSDYYDIEYQVGKLTVIPAPLHVVSDNRTKEYDGAQLEGGGYFISNGSIPADYELRVEFNNAITDAGSVDNSFTAAVYDSLGNDKSSSFALSTSFGSLTVTPRYVKAQSASETKEYDGTALKKEEMTVIEGSIVEGQTLTATYGNGLTVVGSMENAFILTVTDENGADKSANYSFTYMNGTLTVTPRQISLSFSGAQKEYDGTPLTKEEYTITSGSIVPDQTLTVTYEGMQTEKGSSKNTGSIAITDLAGNNVLSNYQAELIFGDLVVTPRLLTIATGTADKEYDGEPLTKDAYEIENGSVAPNQNLEIEVTGSRTEIGVGNNTANVRVIGEEGTEVTSNYDLTVKEGVLTVNPRAITIKTSGDTKEYDGTPLTKEEWTVTSGNLVLSHNLEVVVTGSQTEVGQSYNTATVVVKNGAGENVTQNYAITVEEGQLIVTARKLTVKINDASKVYDGEALTSSSYEITVGQPYEGDRLVVTTTGSQTEVGSSVNTATVVALNERGENVSAHYEFTVNEGNLTVFPRAITIKTAGDTKEYDGTPLTKDEWTVTSGNLALSHNLEVVVTGSQTEVGQSYNTATVVVKNGAGENVTQNYAITVEEGRLIVTARKLTVKINDASKVYDGEALTSSSYEITVGQPYEGDRLVVTTTGSQTEVGSSVNTATVVALNERGENVSAHYEFTVDEGNLTVTPREIKITTGSAEKIYDGLPLTKDEWTRTSGNLVLDHYLEIVVTGSRTEVGFGDNTAAVVVKDGNEKEVTNNYKIELVRGTLRVTPRDITVTTNSAEKPYDGTPLTMEGGAVTNGELLSGHSIVITTTGSQTAAGKSNNYATTRITDEQGRDVTRNYSVGYTYGKLTVLPRVIAIETEGGGKQYDGTPLTGGYTLVSGNVLPEHTMSVTTLGSIVNVGTVANEANIVVTDENGVDVSGNYQFEVAEGILKIEPRRLYVSTETKSKTYDGQILQSTSFAYAENSPQLLPEHTMTATFAYLIDAGTMENAILQYVIKNGEEDVTKNYEMIGNWGRLTVRVRSITIQTGSAAKDYDGMPLTCNQWTLVEITPLVQGHTMAVAVTGTRTEIGEAANSVGACVICDENANDVTHNYSINVQSGILVVRDPNKSNGGQTEGDLGQIGAPGSGDLGGGAPEGKPVPVLRIKSDTSGTVYLRYDSFGDYIGTGFSNGVEYGSLLNGTHSANYLPAYALQEQGAKLNQISIDIYGGGYYLSPYYEGVTNPYPQTSDIYAEGDASEVYTLWYYAYDYLSDGGLAGATSLSSAELAYRRFVNNHYLSVPTDTAAYLNTIIADKGFSRSDPYLVGAVANYIRNAAKYDKEYLNTLVDGKTLDQQPDCVVSFLRDYQVGVCRHYAASATMLFRCLGIPARYVGGYVASAKAGEWIEVTTMSAHAWTEVYIDGLGWVAVEVTGSSYGGGFDGESGEEGEGGAGSNVLKIRPFNRYFLYDGVHTFQYNLKTLQGMSEFTEEKGFTYTFNVEGSASAIGIVETKITNFALYKDGVDVTNQYQFDYGTGKLQVYCFEITVTTEGATKAYDGKPLTVDGYSVLGGENGHVVRIQTTGSITDVGKKSNTFTIHIYEGDVEVTDMYKINSKFGSLEITPIEITVTAASAEKKQDGKPLTNGNYSISGALAEGHTVKSVTVNGTVVRPGRADNVVGEVIIVDQNGVDVTQNYVIHKVNGTLTIKP